MQRADGLSPVYAIDYGISRRREHHRQGSALSEESRWTPFSSATNNYADNAALASKCLDRLYNVRATPASHLELLGQVKDLIKPLKMPVPMHRAATKLQVVTLSDHFQRGDTQMFQTAVHDENIVFGRDASPTAIREMPAIRLPICGQAHVNQAQQVSSTESSDTPICYVDSINHQNKQATLSKAATNASQRLSKHFVRTVGLSASAGQAADRMSLLQKLAVPLPKPRFRSRCNLHAISNFESLTSVVRRRIWFYVMCSCRLDGRLARDLINFTEGGGISGLPEHFINPRAIVRLLNRYTISTLCYEDASTAFFINILPFMVSKVCSWQEYEILEKYVLRGCPSHFVRFNLDFQLFTGPRSAIHHIEMRAMVNYMNHNGMATKGSVRIDDSMRDRLQQDGFFVEDKSKPQNQLLTLRRAPEQVLSQLNMDGCIGNLYWWVHSFNDYILMNRTHWKRMPALMADFSAQMRYWITRHGIAYPGTARFSCLLVAWRECCFDAEQSQSIQMAWSTVKAWEDASYL